MTVAANEGKWYNDLKTVKEMSFMKHHCAGLLAILTACVLVLSAAAVQAEQMELPEKLEIIEEAAFAGDTSLYSVVLPEGLQEIGAQAFAGSSLAYITFPSTLSCIANDAFSGVTAPLLINSANNPYGVGYALANDLDFRADTVCRALLIGQKDYPFPLNNLSAPPRDAQATADLLCADFRTDLRLNLTADEILSAISESFADATDADISLFYYSGHGQASDVSEENGSLIGIDYPAIVTPAQLRAALDQVRGRKIVIMDACCSGAMIGRGRANDSQSIASPAEAFVQAFRAGSDVFASSLTGDRYFVLAGCAGAEECYESRSGGVFTNALISSRTSADRNQDGVVTLQECYLYTSESVQSLVGTANLMQTVQVFPENCSWFGLFR